MATVLRPLQVTRINPVDSRVAVTSQLAQGAAFVLLLTVAGVKPGLQTEWPNPRGPQIPVSNTGFVQPTNLALLTAPVAAPFSGRADPVPPAPGRAHVGFTQAAQTQLIGQDKLFAGPGQVPAFDWQVPRGYQHPVSLRTHLNPLNLLAGLDQFFGAPGQPPANLDWPVPKGRPHPIDARTWLQSQSLPANVIPVNPPPGAPVMPNPQTRAFNVATFAPVTTNFLPLQVGVIWTPVTSPSGIWTATAGSTSTWTPVSAASGSWTASS